MLCRHPYIKDRSVTRLETRMSKEKRLAATPFPCGQCLHCRINQARVWQHRILLESMTHANNLWVTLTYSEEHLPNPPHVSKEEIQKFLKRLRRNVEPFRYFIVGEYGFEGKRAINPHYHGCFFGLSHNDVQAIFQAWGKAEPEGFKIGEITPESARYTSGYTTAKLTKRRDLKRYGLKPEFMLSSRKNGGIGYPAIIQIAKTWRNSKWRDERIIREFKNGRVNRPLGRYLTTKLALLLKIPEEKFEGEYWLHQEEIFEKHLKSDPVDYYESLVNEEETKAISREKKQKMFNIRKL